MALATWRDRRNTLPDPSKRTTIVFQGGGTKGAFQAGALCFLEDRWEALNVATVIGSSTGSFSALHAVAYGPGAGRKLAHYYDRLRRGDFDDWSAKYSRIGELLDKSIVPGILDSSLPGQTRAFRNTFKVSRGSSSLPTGASELDDWVDLGQLGLAAMGVGVIAVEKAAASLGLYISHIGSYSRVKYPNSIHWHFKEHPKEKGCLDAKFWAEGNEFWIVARNYEPQWVQDKAKLLQKALRETV